MDFTRLLAIVGDEPVFETGLLLAGDVSLDHIRRQPSRCVVRLCRDLSALAPRSAISRHTRSWAPIG